MKKAPYKISFGAAAKRLSAVERKAVAAFRIAVQAELAQCSRLGVACAVLKRGAIVRGVPRWRRGGRFVVE